MEFLIGRILEDATINLGLYDQAAEAMAAVGQDLRAVISDEPDAALGNGGLGRSGGLLHGVYGHAGLPGLRLRHPL
jgi:glycogen phosphorylase